jgi:hypothetical protein
MNNRTRILVTSFALAAVCVLPGCSKSADAKSRAGTGSGSETVSAPPAGPVTLKVNWAVGKEYAMRMEMNETDEFNVPDEPKPVKQVRSTTLDYTISALKELADGRRELELKFTACKVNFADGARQTISFDSSRDAAPDASDPIGSLFHRLIGEHVRLLVSADARSIKVDGLDAFTDRVAGNGQSPARGMFKQIFNEEIFKQLSMSDDDTPDHPLNAGDHWPVNLEIPSSLGIIVIHMKSTLKEWESHAGRQCVRIAFKGDISSKPNPNSANTSGKIEGGTIFGQTWFDPALGMTVEINDAEEMPLQIKNRGRMITGQIHRQATRTLLDVTDIGK